MTTFDLRTLRIRSGDQARERVEIELEPLLLAGQTYEPRPNPVDAELTITRASSGTVLELAFEVTLGWAVLPLPGRRRAAALAPPA